MSKAKRQCENEKDPKRSKRMRLESPDEQPAVAVSTKKIIDVNDDCLVKIFGHLGLKDQFNVAIASEWLRPAARDVYQRKFGMKEVSISRCDDAVSPKTRKNTGSGSAICKTTAPEESSDEIKIYGLKTALQYLRCFGPSISDISIRYNKSKSKRYQHVHHYINQYCTESLAEIVFYEKPNISIENFVKPFNNVKKVIVCFSVLGQQLPSFVEWFPNLLELYLRDVSLDCHFMNAPFHHLEHLQIIDHCHNGLMIKSMSALLPLNRPLKALQIKMASRYRLKMKTLLQIIKDNPLISKLKVKNYGYDPDNEVNSDEVHRLVSEHPSLVKLNLQHYQFTAKTAIELIRPLGSLEKCKFQMMNLFQYTRLKPQLDDEWTQMERQVSIPGHADIRYIMLKRQN